MISDGLPLLYIFNQLRQRGFPLGVDDYMTVLRSLQAGFGLADRGELVQLCCMLWAKSVDDCRLIQGLFRQFWPQYLPDRTSMPDRPGDSLARETEPVPEKTPASPESQPSETEWGEISPPKLKISFSPTLEEEPVQVVQAVRRRGGYSGDFRRPRYSLLTEYFPVTKREMKQTWRYLRRPVREGALLELDVEATVEKMGRAGILLEPVLVPRRVNRTDLVLLIDSEGSMVPFHGLSRQLVETARRGGRLRQTRVYYFHDYPDKYLYRHPALLNAQPIAEVFEEIGERAVVLIISDGGAARGYFDAERVEYTSDFIEQLQQSVRYLAWLNPMPSDDWQDNTAGEIAQFVPMFEMSRDGMNGAINAMRGGRDVAGEKMYYG